MLARLSVGLAALLAELFADAVLLFGLGAGAAGALGAALGAGALGVGLGFAAAFFAAGFGAGAAGAFGLAEGGPVRPRPAAPLPPPRPGTGFGPDAKTLEASLDAASAASARCSGVMKASFSPASLAALAATSKAFVESRPFADLCAAARPAALAKTGMMTCGRSWVFSPAVVAALMAA